MKKFVFSVFFCMSIPNLFADGISTPTPISFQKPETVKQQVADDFILYAEIEQEVRDGKLIKKHKTEESDRFPLEWTLYLDHSEKVREYIEEGGSEDNAETVKYYYDESGRLRVVANDYGDVYGTDDEQIILLDLRGQILQVNVEENFVNKEMGRNEHQKKVLKEPVDFNSTKVEFVHDPLKRFKKQK